MELICQIGNIAINDYDCQLTKSIIQDMPLLYKVFQTGNEQDLSLSLSKKSYSVCQNYPLASEFFQTRIVDLVYRIFESSTQEWRSFELSLSFLKQSIHLMKRLEIR